MNKVREALRTLWTLLKSGPFGRGPVRIDDHTKAAAGIEE